MNLEIIGAGFGRTGTQSLKFALEQLGLGPCYHMTEVFQHPEHIPFWAAAQRGEAVDWDDVFRAFRSTVDWPGCAFWRDLAERNPNAKILLSFRDSNAWYESFRNTILETMRQDLSDAPPLAREHFETTRQMILEDALRGRPDDRAHAIRCYEEHNEAVKSEVPPDRLILYEVGEGWAPLCRGLDVPIPDSPYPRMNSTKEFRERLEAMRADRTTKDA